MNFATRSSLCYLFW